MTSYLSSGAIDDSVREIHAFQLKKGNIFGVPSQMKERDYLLLHELAMRIQIVTMVVES